MPVYQDKNTKKWKVRVYVTDIYGNRKQIERKWFDTKREALQKETELKLAEKNDVSNITFEELWNEYKTNIEVKLKFQSYRAIISRVNNHILPYFKNYKINKITNSVYIKWQREIESKGYKYKYKSSLHTAMVGILNYGIKFYDLKQNIASLTGNFKRKNEIKSKAECYSYEEFSKFINVVDNNVYKAFFNTLYFTGLRLGEATSLKWIDFKGDTISVSKTISKEQQDGERVVTPPKNDTSCRIVKLNDDLIKELNELKEFYKNTINFEEDWFIFGGLKPLAPTTIRRRKEKYCELANVKKIKIHEFRHSHASLLISLNVPLPAVSERLGHSNTNTTLSTYSHMLPKDEDQAVSSLNQLKQSNKI